MMLIEQEVNRILVEAESSGGSLRQLYELYKKHTRKCSLAYICRRAGIPSKGYLAFVMAGERKLHTKYWDSVSAAFKLNERQSEVFQILLERDAEPDRRFHLDEILQDRRGQLN